MNRLSVWEKGENLRGEGGERVRACRQTLSPNREPVHRLKDSQKPEAQGVKFFPRSRP